MPTWRGAAGAQMAAAAKNCPLTWVQPIIVTLVAFGLAHAARHGLVEPADLTARCDAARWGDSACVVRTLVVQTFVDQRIGLLAMACGLWATGVRSRGLAVIGLASGAAGLVLYSAGPAAAGLLLSALVWVRPGTPSADEAGSRVR